jgi:hypothetical protein
VESKMLEDLEEDGRNINLVLEGMVVKTLGPATRMNSTLSVLPCRCSSQRRVGY